MADRINRNIDWVTDESGELVGYADKFGRRSHVPRIVYDEAGNATGLVGPGGANPLAALGAEVEGLKSKAIVNAHALAATTTTALNNTEQLLSQCVLSSNQIQNRSRLDILLVASKINGTSDTATFRLRIGKTGTNTDPILVSAGLASTTISWPYRTSVQLFDDGFRQLGINTAVVPTPGAATAVVAAKQTVSDFLAGNVFVSVYCVMTSGATERGELSVFEIDVRK